MLHLLDLKSARTQRCNKECITQDESGRLAGSVRTVVAKQQHPSEQEPGEINREQSSFKVQVRISRRNLLRVGDMWYNLNTQVRASRAGHRQFYTK